MTGMIGFLNRMCDEWGVPDGVQVVPVYDYLADPSSLEPDAEELSRETDRARSERVANKQWMEKRIVVKEFLEHMFQFSPDEHVRSSYTPDPKNDAREMFDTLAGKLAVQHKCHKDPKFADRLRIYNEQQTAMGRPLYDEGVVGSVGDHMKLAYGHVDKLEGALNNLLEVEAVNVDDAESKEDEVKEVEKPKSKAEVDMREQIARASREANRQFWRAKKSELPQDRLVAAEHTHTKLHAKLSALNYEAIVALTYHDFMKQGMTKDDATSLCVKIKEEQVEEEKNLSIAIEESAENVARLQKLIVDGPPDAYDPTACATVREMIPPVDTFHRWTYYMESNHENILSAVYDLYCEIPEFELAVNPYDWHENLKDADEFIHKHREEVVADIHKSESGKWNVISNYRKGRESIRFFNDNTLVLEEIMAQQERDAKLGGDLMKKRVQKKKKKNIEEDGPDDPMFAKWKASSGGLKGTGAENVNQSSYADDECPDDGIQVDVFSFSKGGKTLKKTKFYSQAEAPEHMTKQKKKA
jgi:hypothetical protein